MNKKRNTLDRYQAAAERTLPAIAERADKGDKGAMLVLRRYRRWFRIDSGVWKGAKNYAARADIIRKVIAPPMPESEYRKLASTILNEDLETAPLLLPKLDKPHPYNIGDLTDVDDQRLASALGIAPGDWATLNEEQRLGRMEAHPSSGWLTQAEVARKLGMNKPRIKRLIDRKELKSNEKTGRECRVELASVIAYCDREGIAYNLS